MDKAEGYDRAKAFYKAETNLPCDVDRYVGCSWQSFIDGRAEFAFQREARGKSQLVCIVFNEKDLTGSVEALDGELQKTLQPSYHRFLPCRNQYGSSIDGGTKGLRKWERK